MEEYYFKHNRMIEVQRHTLEPRYNDNRDWLIYNNTNNLFEPYGNSYAAGVTNPEETEISYPRRIEKEFDMTEVTFEEWNTLKTNILWMWMAQERSRSSVPALESTDPDPVPKVKKKKK